METFGCLYSGHLKGVQFYSRPFKYCSKNYSRSEEFRSTCEVKCKPDCDMNNYRFFVKNTHESHNCINCTSIMNIYPREKPYLKYIYKAKMDFNRLIYNLGGIMWLWFGLSSFTFMYSIIEGFKWILTLIKKNCSLFERNKVSVIRIKAKIEKKSISKAIMKRSSTI